MTATLTDLRRRPAKPAGSLFRVTAAVSFLTLLVLWAVYEWWPSPEFESCHRTAGGEPCPPSVDSVGSALDPPYLILVTALVELVAIGGYLALAAARRTLDLRTGLRWSPAAVAVVALAVGGFGWMMDGGDLNGLDSVAPGFLLLFAGWLLTPLVLYGVHRGDRGAVILVVIGLAPTAVCNAMLVQDYPAGALPGVMLVVSTVVVVIVRRRD
ncbi:hypothetical protein EV137_1642 [Kribbella pratensis]|uniref:DUF998 domain-containing protein n=1 Tax=Kribbella pratensis TaxID=2512112 RepID=A0ABY2FMH5_9ACTN|nr:hypothetical protein [Kribbella pratensis]TDW94338.1 hypothetical protein EV137_1642 [Kribbella pratensis]